MIKVPQAKYGIMYSPESSKLGYWMSCFQTVINYFGTVKMPTFLGCQPTFKGVLDNGKCLTMYVSEENKFSFLSVYIITMEHVNYIAGFD